MAFLRKAFERFDADGSGTISKTELQKACESLGKSFTDRQIKHIMSKADADQSGELEYEEFAASIEGTIPKKVLKNVTYFSSNAQSCVTFVISLLVPVHTRYDNLVCFSL